MDVTAADRSERDELASGHGFEPFTPADERFLAMLRERALRPTRQRVALMRLLFGAGDRHVGAEQLRAEATAAEGRIPLATIYNSLRQFVEAGLLREVATIGTRCIFDTRIDPHHHFLLVETGEMIDVAPAAVEISRLPEPPEGMEIESCEVIVRLRRRSSRA